MQLSDEDLIEHVGKENQIDRLTRKAEGAR
jgi:hypothetical protein